MRTLPTRWVKAAAPPILFFSLAVCQARAQRRISGQQNVAVRYRCVQVEVADAVAHCAGRPLLTLNSDGSYQFARELGTYEFVEGRWLVLTQSRLRGLVSYREIVFEYREGEREYRVVYRRVVAPLPGIRQS